MSDTTPKKKRILPKILLVILLIICCLAGFIFFNASKNMKQMKKTVDSGMEVISSYADVKPVDAGEYSQIKMKGIMKFNVSQYDVENLGNLSVMTVNMGFM